MNKNSSAYRPDKKQSFTVSNYLDMVGDKGQGKKEILKSLVNSGQDSKRFMGRYIKNNTGVIGG